MEKSQQGRCSVECAVASEEGRVGDEAAGGRGTPARQAEKDLGEKVLHQLRRRGFGRHLRRHRGFGLWSVEARILCG
jgi:hypothetical protein